MKILKNFFPYALPGREIKTILLILVFMVLTILYYFLRFQFGQPALFAIAQVSTLVLLGVLAVGMLVIGKYKFRHDLDFVLFLFLVHASLFCAVAVFRDGIYKGGWAINTSLLPILVYFYVSNALSPVGASRVLMLMEFVLLAVAIIYIAEFVNLHVLQRGYFTYSRLLSEHAIERDTIISSSWIQGDFYRYVRMAGPLSHQNTTGLALALGFVLSMTRYISTRKVLTTVPFIVVFAVALFLSGARTSLLAGIVGALSATFSMTRISLTKVLPRLIFVAVMLYATLNWLIAMKVIDFSAFGQTICLS